MEPSLNVDKLCHEIFSILENKFLSDRHEPNLFLATESPSSVRPPNASTIGRVRILSIDGGSSASNCLFARLKAFLRNLSNDPASRIADFFDLATRSSTSGVLAVMLFIRASNGRPLFSANEAHYLLSKNRPRLATSDEQGFLHKIFQ
ncbi:putative Patatin-like protein 6 [Cocos nucifera]|uniref:Putative Patatin-like protein 6 n=1 Tax=Cocos nucifera TaxID=13894 RepID=A0A8K0IDN6_COCNU|nr:putative Patatin-like protein 6 [Cocos nucifera]